MIGLVMLVAGVAYIALLVWVTRGLFRRAKRQGHSKLRCWLAGVVGFLIVYLPVFWDHIPTLVAHRYYCSTQAGFWVFKTLTQWDIENPGVIETLIYERTMPRVSTPYGEGTALNQRIVHLFKLTGPKFPNLWIKEVEIRDQKTGSLIAREVDFSTSQERRRPGWSGWKFWLDRSNCDTVRHKDPGSFDKIVAQFEGVHK